jgi:signal transduction histidine kinase
VDEITEQMRLVASYSGLRIKTDWHCARPLSVRSNRDRIEQVLIALVDNAIKFASDEGTITLDVSLSSDGKSAIVAVMNTGYIDEKHLPHLFERFYKADAAHSDGGTGLGLAIVQEVLAHLGESIEARNEGENAVFRFTIGL